MSILVTRCLKRSELVRELFDEVHAEWQPEQTREPMFACDLEELCGECLQLTDLCKHVWAILRSSLHKIPNTQTTGRAFQSALTKSLEVVKAVLDLRDHADLKIALSELTRTKTAVDRDWPFFRKDMMDAAKSAYARGEYRTAEDLLHDAQDDCSGAVVP